MTLLYLVAAWAAGIFFAPEGSPIAPWLALAVVSIVLAYGIRRRPWRLGLVCAALFLLGAARYSWATHPPPADHIQHYVDSGYATVTGVIARDPDVRDQHVNLHIQVESLRLDNTSHQVQGMILVQAPRYGEYAYGDRVEIGGTLLTPPEFDDFSYRDYLARRGIHAMIPNAQVETLEHDQGRPWMAAMYALKTRAQKTIDRLLPSPQAPLLSGILLGVESSIPDDVREAFNRTGTSHIIAISGANIVIVIGVLMKLLKPGLGKHRAGWVTMLGVGSYTLFVGADPAVVRAAIMGSMAILASQSGRKTHGLTSLAFAIWLMTLWNPLTLWDIGFQLSAAATAGLVLLGDFFTGGLERLLRRGFTDQTAQQITRWLSEPIAISLAAQVTTTPLILVYFGRLSIISLLANILIVPVQSFIMTLGWLAVMMGLIWPLLGEPLAWVVWLPLSYTLGIVRALAKPDWASVTVSLSPSYAWSVYAVLLILGLIILQHPDDRTALFQRIRQRITTYGIIVTGTIVTLLVWSMALHQPDGKLHVWFLDVGHGHAVLIKTPDGAYILVDGGPNPTRLRSAVGDRLPFWDRDLDLLVVTQPKTDSINSIPALLDHYNAGLVLTNGHVEDSESYQALVQSWEQHGIEVVPVTAGYRIQTGDNVTLEVLHPQTPPQTEDKIEEQGMVLRLSYGNTSFLLVSDLSEKAEQILLDAAWYIGSTVLELPSHGSAETNSVAFLETVHPQVGAVIVAAGNRAGLPDSETLDRLSAEDIPLYRTDQDGTIEMATDGHTLWIYTEH